MNRTRKRIRCGDELRAIAAGLPAAAMLVLCTACGVEQPRPQPEGPDCSPTGSRSSRFAIELAGASSLPESGRILIDQAPRGDAAPAVDVGSGSFTVELWLRGRAEDQIVPKRGQRSAGGFEVDEYDWIWGNIFLDRDIWDETLRYPGYGASIVRDGERGVVRFGVKTGSTPDGDNREYTLQGERHLLDGRWHHVALVRDAERGRLRIYVDGELDRESSADGMAPRSDLSFPEAAGRVGTPDASSHHPERASLLVIGTEKHDLGDLSPAFHGQVDEIRIWEVARRGSEIAATHAQILAPESPGLVYSLRLEEGGGLELSDRLRGPSAHYREETFLWPPHPWTRDAAPVSCP